MNRQHQSRSPMPARLESRVGMPLSAEAQSVAGTVIGLTGREGSAYINLNARGPDEYFIFSDGFTVDGDGNADFAGDIGAISGTFDVVIGGRWDSASTNPLRGIRLDSSVTKPGTWTDYIDFAATGSSPMIVLGGLVVLANGSAEFSGSLDAATGTFAGTLSAAGGTFTGTVTASAVVAAGSFTAAEAFFDGLVAADSFHGTVGSLISVANLSFSGTSATLDATTINLSATNVGFYGNSAGPIRTVTGAKGGNAALTSLCAQLEAAGLIVDSTT